ncbi:MAG: GGDEF domain-containing protein [Candidatus Kuenenbacteria bacterium]
MENKEMSIEDQLEKKKEKEGEIDELREEFRLRIEKYAEELGVNSDDLFKEYEELESQNRKEHPDVSPDRYEEYDPLLEHSFIKNIELKKLALIDPITGAYNQRFLKEHLTKIEKEILGRGKAHWTRQYKERKNPIEDYSVIIVDIDYFGELNDTYGHPFGDYVLKGLVDLFKAHTRSVDVIARPGGDEFTIVTPSNNGTAIVLANNLRKLLEEKKFVYDGPGEYNGKIIPVTASFGVAEWSKGADKTVKSADEALYGAKKDGRNCVFYYNPEGKPKKFVAKSAKRKRVRS